MELPIEYFGTAASVIVAVSLTQKNIKRLRILNGIGAVAFALYGFMIKAWPVFGLNAFIALIDIYYLIEMKRGKDYFELMKIEHPADSTYLNGFLDFYLDDMQKFMPEFSMEIMKDADAVFVLRDMMPVSLVIFSETGDRVEIFADYALPAYRDGENSRYFFDKLTETIDGKKKTFISKPGSRLHNKYLKTMGFIYSEKENLYICSKIRE